MSEGEGGGHPGWAAPGPPCLGLTASSPPHRVFFDSCDGFFTNYNWREEHLQRMLGQAGERRADVYVGVDVFARGNVVGGQFHTHKVGGGPAGRGAGGGGLHAFRGWVFSWTFHCHLHSRQREAAFFPERGS